MNPDSVEDYVAATPRSRALHERATAVMPGGDTRSVTFHEPYPSYVQSASGCRLLTEDDEELLDFLNNYTQSVLGHAPPAVVEAVTDRFARGNGVGAPTDDAVVLAERLVDRVPSIEQVRFGNSGTEATMNAIRAAMAHTGEETVLKLQGGYHGTHDTVEVAVEGDGREHAGIPRDVERRVVTAPFNDIDALKDRFERHGDELACFILEPLMGVAGGISPELAFLETARDLTEEYDVPLIFDEVMTMRLAHGGAQARYGVTPDLTALGKFIGGGLPVGAFGGREDLMNAFHPEDGVAHHSGTFNANPATMAGGVATLEALDTAAIERLNELGNRLRREARAIVAGHDLDVTVTGDGSMFQLHRTSGPVTDAESAAAGTDAFEELFLAMRNRGVFMAPRGMGNLSTPMDDAEIDEFLAVLDDSLAAVEA
ncbi:Glutamate-1-semialdehyde 2,1-aminomutase [halophilic archaeon DL31]|jgi:glutamate-1-semialdehyde 2,1-aminomutase|nr:Glutamate-1-semialdehyde 2,1-aminomutase [halophilic archaeon DL31]